MNIQKSKVQTAKDSIYGIIYKKQLKKWNPRPENNHKLFLALQEEWQAIPRNIYINLVTSVSRRIEECIRKEGGPTTHEELPFIQRRSLEKRPRLCYEHADSLTRHNTLHNTYKRRPLTSSPLKDSLGAEPVDIILANSQTHSASTIDGYISIQNEVKFNASNLEEPVDEQLIDGDSPRLVLSNRKASDFA
ncbi:hypothetical protein G9A89_005791 [Geosiphon pyriformis]|nr:hypothetical protein G9A89_005791 [Geosiphon pyriformis]